MLATIVDLDTNSQQCRTLMYKPFHDYCSYSLSCSQKIPLALVCNGDIDRPLRVEVLDWDKNGKHVYMGQVRVNVVSAVSMCYVIDCVCM